jgi:hypothetical protein
VTLTFSLVIAVMGFITLVGPLKEARRLPERNDLDLRTSRSVYVTGAAVIIGVGLFFIVFW